jgi:uncharacterized protein (DUF362 family)
MQVYIEKCSDYNIDKIRAIVSSWETVFNNIIDTGSTVVIKPNWIRDSHKCLCNEWVQVITHTNIITCVLEIVLKLLNGNGKVIITDGPQTSSCWQYIMARMEPELWLKMGLKHNIDVSIIDLRDHEWIIKGDIIVNRNNLPGDPKGSTICNLGPYSEFIGKTVPQLGFCGADYDQSETNAAHSNGNHFYKVSRTVLEADVFINLPKLKTHKKAGITCSLKNLVGINTYKNWLPHHSEGTLSEGGDQFPENGIRATIEGSFSRAFYNFLLNNPKTAIYLIPFKKVAKIIFGDTRKTIRNGSWYGNDTLWRTVLDLNKILFYANSDGSLRECRPENMKKYISIVDAVVSGDGNGPDMPDKIETGFLLLGTNPVSVDTVCAKIMGFDYKKIPTIINAYNISNYPICNFSFEDIQLLSSDVDYNNKLSLVMFHYDFKITPAFGWIGNIEDVL